ncbi:hypothetical protein LO763_02705 [Glycomyces sp. A-F 0318]|uniref:hypothetical protein n=1 Tax=Glycomyces amatae TaxID=2881355 RepID=UPI001E6143E3|nr:hypothetical protein [Glycomyces amatae]MCD0442533.1 hypothetical protein [Glycomyces amatae]
MNDQYRATAPTPPPQAALGHYKLTTAALWIGLLGGAVLNTGLQLVGVWLIAVPFGAIAAGCAVALVVRAVVSRKQAGSEQRR